VRPFILPAKNQDEEQFTTTGSQQRVDDFGTFFTTATERQRCEYLLQELRDGRQLPHSRDRPEYSFNLPLGGKDWGPQMTKIYDATRKKTDLTFEDLNDIAYVFLRYCKWTVLCSGWYMGNCNVFFLFVGFCQVYFMLTKSMRIF